MGGVCHHAERNSNKDETPAAPVFILGLLLQLTHGWGGELLSTAQEQEQRGILPALKCYPWAKPNKWAELPASI